jgi:quinol monooxygenase YgiN
MKKLLLFLLCFPLIAICQKPTVISYNRFMPKNDKVLEFEKGLQAHAMKYHNNEWKWRVYTIESGPDAGGYMVIEGPSTWDALDKRGTLGTAHMQDFNKNVLPYTTEKNSIGYLTFREELSTVQLTDYTEKIAITHVFPNPGRGMSIEASISLLKKAWDEGQQTIAVYESSSSGAPQYSIVTRYKQGLKEKETTFRKPMKERYDAVNGSGSFDKFAASATTDVDHQWSELLFLNKELSSKE